MVDRQDIDALLVSALYGELTPADEARLAAHLESHPTDRTVLADLTRARAAVRDSRIFDVQLEPPQAVSALLLQEAARRAPRMVEADRPGWLARFFHSMVAHPAMAAAMTLVVVVGVAGTLFLKRGDSAFVEPTVETEQKAANNETARLETPPATAVEPAAAPAAEPEKLAQDRARNDKDGDGKPDETPRQAAGSGSAYGVDLHDSVAHRDDAYHGTNGRVADLRKQADGSKRQATKPSAPTGGIVVRSTERTPKELDDNKQKAGKELALATGGDAVAGAGASTGSVAPTTPAPGFAGEAQRNQPTTTRTPVAKADAKAEAKPEPMRPSAQPPAAATPAAPPPPPPPAVTRGPEDKKAAEDKKKLDDDAWARNELARAIALVRDKKCQDAAKVVTGISVRAPAFYSQNVADHRDLKPCNAYISSDRDKENERRAKSRPAKKSSPAEADAPAANQ